MARKIAMAVLTPRQILDQLVKFPTVSSESNLALVDWLESSLTGHGVRCARHWNEDRQSRGKPGRRIPGRWLNATGGFTVAGPAT
jgi:hypothetical protein